MKPAGSPGAHATAAYIVMPEEIAGDAHVHIYDAYDLDRLLGQARRRARTLSCPLLLLLSESQGYRAFERLSSRLLPTQEPESLRVPTREEDTPPVYVIAGRQVVSSQDTEVLGLGIGPERPESYLADRTLDTASLVERFLTAGAITVLPWGVGKWIGARGRHVQRLVETARFREHARFFVGDIEQRCPPWPAPAAFRRVRVLAGTDLLPLPGVEARVAAYGFRVPARPDSARPLTSLLEAFDGRHALRTTGRRASPRRVLTEQFQYRLLKARGRAK